MIEPSPRVLFVSDADFLEMKGECSCGMAIYFEHSLVFITVVFEYRCYSVKEAESHAISVAMKMAKEFGILKPTFFRTLWMLSML